MKFRLLAKHYIDDRLLEEGTVVGDDTPFRLPQGPTPDMEGLDDESKKAVADLVEKIHSQQLPAAPQLGLLYLEPDVKAALRKSLGLDEEAAKKKEEEEKKKGSPTPPSGAPQHHAPPPKEK